MAMTKVLVVVLYSSMCWGAACTASVTGDWNNPATWGNSCPVDGGVPGDGDTATIRDGTTLTIPPGLTVVVGLNSGADTDDAPALQSDGPNGTGVLVVNGTLIYKGPVRQGNATWIVNAGGALEHAGTAASYTWKIGRSTGTTARLVLAGTKNNRVIIRKAFGALNAGTIGSGGTVGGGGVDFTYARISDVGAPDTDAFRLTTGTYTRSWTLSHTLIDRCGIIRMDHPLSATSTFRIDSSSLRDGLSATHQIRFHGAPEITTGVRRITNSYIENGFRFFGSTGSQTGLYIDNVVFASKSGSITPIDFVLGRTVSHWDRVLIWRNESNASGYAIGPAGGRLTRTLLMLTGQVTTGGPYGVDFRIPADNNEALTLDGWIMGYELDKESGDLLTVKREPSSGGKVITVRNSIELPNRSGRQSGAFFQTTASLKRTSIHIEQNTFVSSASEPDGRGAIAGVGAEGPIELAPKTFTVRKNIVWRRTGRFGYIATPSKAASANGAYTTPANPRAWVADFNWTYNLSENGYALTPASTDYDPSPPGPNDRSGDPNFVDPARDFITWAQSLNPAVNTYDLIRAEFSRMNDDAGYDSRFNIADAHRWIYYGWISRNPATWHGCDGSHCGIDPSPLMVDDHP